MSETLYPMQVEMKLHITDGDTVGSVSYSFPVHRLPTGADMPRVLDEIGKALPDGYRLMTRHESLMHFLREEKGYRGPNIALPALDEGQEWHDPAAADVMSFSRHDDMDEDE